MQFYLPIFDALTPQMKNLVNFPLTQNFLVVWAPWTGKSVVATHRFQYLKSQDKKVIFLCYNNLLNQLLKNHCDEKMCRTLDSFYGHVTYLNNWNQKSEWLMIWDENIDIVRANFTQYVNQQGKFDAIIIDEAQDLSIEIIDAITILSDHLSLFADPNQPLKDPSSDVGQIQYLFQDIHLEILTRNYRNTKEIYEFAAKQFMNGNELANNPALTLSSVSDISSQPLIIQNVITLDQQIIEIQNIVWEYPSNTIGIFVADIEKVENLYQHFQNTTADVTCYHSRNKTFDKHKKRLITTYTSAKGLEFDIVIILVDNMKDKEKINQKLYVLSTRAKKKLYYLFT